MSDADTSFGWVLTQRSVPKRLESISTSIHQLIFIVRSATMFVPTVQATLRIQPHQTVGSLSILIDTSPQFVTSLVVFHKGEQVAKCSLGEDDSSVFQGDGATAAPSPIYIMQRHG